VLSLSTEIFGGKGELHQIAKNDQKKVSFIEMGSAINKLISFSEKC